MIPNHDPYEYIPRVVSQLVKVELVFLRDRALVEQLELEEYFHTERSGFDPHHNLPVRKISFHTCIGRVGNRGDDMKGYG